ncbi:MAG: histidinol dehydrogenase [Actinobacteria bacterium]|nr:histidinol dehydrogenase [Actinomycetota bacterium]
MLELIDGRDTHAPVHIARPKPAGVAGDPGQGVRAIIEAVRSNGDAALIDFTRRFDGARLTSDSVRVPEETIMGAVKLVPPEVIDALRVLERRLRKTCERQLPRGWMDYTDGEMIGELIRPLRRIGLYAPGGRAAYPSSVMMGAVPAFVAGVDTVAVCSPPTARGEISEAVLAACAVAGITEVYRMGGAQAVAAFAYGTETVRPVEKIVGPGNIHVTRAKREVQGWVGIDSEAGPTELLIVADESASPEDLAADLVAQAEHGPLGSHVLVTWKPDLANAVMAQLDVEVARHERADDVENALIEGGRAVLVRDTDHAMQTANAFAPEHLQLVFRGALEWLDRVRNAGAVFVGAATPVPVGDYVAGTNHILPTGGTARWASGLGVGDFIKRIYVYGTEEGSLMQLAPHVEALAKSEGLPGHGRAVRVRLSKGASAS